MKTLYVPSLGEWRRWLATNHASESEVWLIFPKKHTRQPCVSYSDALDEALCFGWVDSLIKRLDDDRYARKFTPRKEDSKWSDENRRRYAKLQASGRLMPPGLKRPPTDRRYDRPPLRPSKVPAYIREALRKSPKALRNFETLAPSQRLRYAHWVDSAKRTETKARRLQEAIRLLAAGKELGLK